MSDQTVHVFDLTLDRIPVQLKTDAGIEDCYLEEMEGLTRDELLNQEKMQLDNKNNLKSFKDILTRLIVKTLKHADGTDFTLEEVRKFPAKVQKELHRLSSELNGLDQEKVDLEAKNASSQEQTT